VSVRFAPKPTKLLRGCEMTRCAISGLMAPRQRIRVFNLLDLTKQVELALFYDAKLDLAK
jgi:hypothetical protein